MRDMLMSGDAKEKQLVNRSLDQEKTPNSECMRCGACCASFRVSFYWGETNAAEGGVVPEAYTEQVTPFLCAMRGTNSNSPHCAGLQGAVGASVSCSIYENRPSPCREFHQSWEGGIHNETCDRARRMWGLAPIGRREVRGQALHSTQNYDGAL